MFQINEIKFKLDSFTQFHSNCSRIFLKLLKNVFSYLETSDEKNGSEGNRWRCMFQHK